MVYFMENPSPLNGELGVFSERLRKALENHGSIGKSSFMLVESTWIPSLTGPHFYGKFNHQNIRLVYGSALLAWHISGFLNFSSTSMWKLTGGYVGWAYQLDICRVVETSLCTCFWNMCTLDTKSPCAKTQCRNFEVLNPGETRNSTPQPNHNHHNPPH